MLNALGIDGPGRVVMRGERATLGHKGRALLRGGRQSPDQLGGTRTCFLPIVQNIYIFLKRDTPLEV